MTDSRPPKFAAWLLERILPIDVAEAILGDLEEEFRTRILPRRGRWPATRWYLARAAALLFRLTPVGDHTRASQLRVRGGPMFHDTWLDLRYGVRMFTRAPGFTLITVSTLALGIAATSTILSVVNPVLFEPLPYPNPRQLVMVWEREPSGASSNTGYATFADIRRDSKTLGSIAAMSYWTPTLQGDDPEQLVGQSVTADFFRTLGVHPFIGRDFTPEEDAPNQNRVVILSYGLWQRRFGSDPTVVGRTISVSSRPYEVVGVLPYEFESLLDPNAQIWRPLGYDASLDWACRTCRHLRAVARLKEDRTIEQAAVELQTLSETYVRDYPTEYAAPGINVVPLHDDLVQHVRSALLVVLVAVGFVLLIACANVMNLLLSRALQRQNEFAIRTALGARPIRVARQVLTETLLLALTSTAAGVTLAWFGVRTVVALAPSDIPRLSGVTLDVPVLMVTLAIAVGSGLLFGFAPVLAVRRANLHDGVHLGARASTTRPQRAMRASLVVAEVTLAFALLAGAGLLIRSLDQLLQTEVGFDADNLLTMEVLASGPAYAESAAVWTMQDRLVEAVGSIAGVASVALASQIPLGGNFDGYGVLREDKPLANPEDAPGAQRYAVSSHFLSTMQIPVRRGRGFTPADRHDAPLVALINDAFAKLYWPGEEPLNTRIKIGGPDAPYRTIIGIVGDTRHGSLDENRVSQIYIPETQWLWADAGVKMVVRGTEDVERLIPEVRSAVRSVDKNLAISSVATASALVRVTTAQRRFAMIAFEIFAAVALVLAAAGIYGVLASSVAQRTREFGIRAAMGATRSVILTMALRQSAQLAAFGLVIGWVGALALARLLQSLLYGVTPTDPVTLGAVTILLGSVALAASFEPAWRAARVDPVTTLRTE